MRKYCFILLIITLLSACSKDEMDRTIFIPDDNDYNLPAYTEWGYNSFGAEYERNYFLASNSIVPCKITYHDNQLRFSLSGRVTGGSYKTTTLSFIFTPSTPILDYSDLVKLNGVKINLTTINCTVTMEQDGDEKTLSVMGGELYFKRTQLLSIDDKVNRVILSGTFDVRFLQNNLPMTMSNGRFDLGITQNVFLSY